MLILKIIEITKSIIDIDIFIIHLLILDGFNPF